MIRNARFQILALALVIFFGAGLSQAATLSPTLQQQISSVPGSTSVGVVVIAFNTDTGLNNSHLDVLRGVGITRGLTLNQLGMVAAPATAAQVSALRNNSAVRSIWSNDQLYYHMDKARVLTGVDRLRTDPGFTSANGGLPVSGRGDFSVVINDSGIDATHSDLRFRDHVIENVQIVTDTDTLTGFTALVAIEGVPNTDSHVGHGTHCAGIVGGTGQMSGGRYAGVAPGAKLIGTGSGYVLFILNALGGFEWSLANQFIHNIRIISNSWGSSGDFNPDNPINIATKMCYERNIVVVFSAGNSGPGRDTHNPYGKAPWVISVAAGTKEGGLANFSSRGVPRSERLGNSDPNDDFDAPTITAPGTGREFASNSGKFTSDIVSVRASSNLVANGGEADLEIPVAFLPFYTQISGTSMACPHVAGVVALMLDADPLLTPDQVKQIITETASRMPGREEWEVGAGYINAYAAVDKVFKRSKSYGSFVEPTFNAQISVRGPAPENWHVDYNPAATPGPGSPNSRTFTVLPGMSVLDVFARFTFPVVGGNTIGILLTDPNGTRYSSGIAIPILNSPNRQVVVKNPVAGQWLLEVRGIRGITTLPNVSLPTSGVALPGPVDGTIKQFEFVLENVTDIEGHEAQAQIESVLKNRMMDIFSTGRFRPDLLVTRQDFARLLMFNTALRQSLADSPLFTDVTSSLRPIAEAVTARGSTLRDWDFTPLGMMGPVGLPTRFRPQLEIIRLDIAVALVRALGLDNEAKARAGTNVTVNYNGQTLVLTDNAEIPPELRGYVQFALDKRILQAFFSLEQGPFDFQPTLKARVKPNDPATRAFMAYALDNFRKSFVAGN